MDSPSSSKPARKTTNAQALYVLDEDFYPDCWTNDQKMGVLLNTFRPRTVNPEHYDQKMKFWKEMIEDYCDYKGCGTVSINELKEVFRRKGSSPYCLQDVFNQMTEEGNLFNKQSFMEVPEKSWSGWAFGLVKKPVSWGFGKIKEKLVATVDDNTTFVVKSSVIRQSRLLQKHVKNCHNYNNIISMDDLMKNDDEIDGLSREGILLSLHYLSTVEQKVYIEENTQPEHSSHHHKILMKFSEPHEKVVPITHMERSIYNLEQTEKYLTTVIEEKEHLLMNILKQAKDCVKDGKKQMAKTYLRKKHMMEADITKTLNILENVQTMLQRVQNSKGDKDILKTYKIGADAIKVAFAESGINLDNVDDIIEDMREVLEEQGDINNVLSEPIRGGSSIDDSELEKELMDLMNANKEDTNLNTNNAGNSPQQKKPVKPITEDLTSLDRELELRLNRLRSDFSNLEDTEQTKLPKTGLTQH